MAALLNPAALTTHPAAEPVSAAANGSTEPASVAPWNRAERRHPVAHRAVGPRSAAPRHLQALPASAVPHRSPLRVLLAGLGLAVLVAFAAMGVVPFLGADAAASTPASTADISSTPEPVVAAAPVSVPPAPAEVVVVQAGDSLWTIARRLQPKGDLRHLVDRLIDRVGATTVSRGQHIDVRGLLD